MTAANTKRKRMARGSGPAMPLLPDRGAMETVEETPAEESKGIAPPTTDAEPVSRP